MKTPRLKLAPARRLSPEELAKARPPGREALASYARLRRAAAQSAEASTVPLPGPLREAFAAPPRELFGVALLPVCGGHVAILQAIDAPFFACIRASQMIVRAKTRKERERIARLTAARQVTVADTAEVLYIFATPAPDLREVLAQPGGREKLREKAMVLLDAMPPIPDWDQIALALGAHYSSCFATQVKFRAREREDGAGNFRSPNPSRTLTGSAGSSI